MPWEYVVCSRLVRWMGRWSRRNILEIENPQNFVAVMREVTVRGSEVYCISGHFPSKPPHKPSFALMGLGP